ncbi:MAG: shikimate kinase [Methanosarcinales archaeon]|nr:shikimate kinase [Methanosarcinales archaeon]
MRGFAFALGAATILNAVANWKGSAFGVNLRTRAYVELDGSEGIQGLVPDVDNRLIVRAVELTLQRYGLTCGGTVRTKSEIPVASGLKSSSAAANAAVLATLDALGQELDLLEAARIGVQAALEVGVTITGAFDDACASMLGGVVVTDNREKALLHRVEMDSSVLLLVPEERAFSSQTDVTRSRLMSPLADLAFELALKGDFRRAMTLNGLLYCAALKRPTEPSVLALAAGASAASLSGTGPSYAALVDGDSLDDVRSAWEDLGGRVIKTEINNQGASRGRGI